MHKETATYLVEKVIYQGTSLQHGQNREGTTMSFKVKEAGILWACDETTI